MATYYGNMLIVGGGGGNLPSIYNTNRITGTSTGRISKGDAVYCVGTDIYPSASYSSYMSYGSIVKAGVALTSASGAGLTVTMLEIPNISSAFYRTTEFS